MSTLGVPGRASDAGPESRTVEPTWQAEMIEAQSSAWYAAQIGEEGRTPEVLKRLRRSEIEECIAHCERALELL